MQKYCFLILFIILGNLSFGQNLQRMQIWQDSLFNLGQKIFSSTSDVERIESNFLFVKTLVSALKESNSYYFNFDQLKMISTIKSPDDTFRVFSWNVPMQDGSYLYYGSIQKKAGDLRLIPLMDKTFQIPKVNSSVLNNTEWYGAQYYEIIPYQKGTYLLLGWKGHNAKESKKVIEVLRFTNDNTIQLGGHIFSDDKEAARKIFTYAKEASMFLQFQKAENRIVFDHLVELETESTKIKVPDLTHNAYLLENPSLKLVENVLVLNVEN